ncbi:MAG: helix-turn-helix domain-containing protein [Clostridia bacterium]|nr:helix-turn-helix domain-containing protein [Clostridia bacterium]
MRLNKAKKELKNCKKTIQQIAEDCGFSNQFYFSRYFTSCYGVSPYQFRKLSTSDF